MTRLHPDLRSFLFGLLTAVLVTALAPPFAAPWREALLRAVMGFGVGALAAPAVVLPSTPLTTGDRIGLALRLSTFWVLPVAILAALPGAVGPGMAAVVLGLPVALVLAMGRMGAPLDRWRSLDDAAWAARWYEPRPEPNLRDMWVVPLLLAAMLGGWLSEAVTEGADWLLVVALIGFAGLFPILPRRRDQLGDVALMLGAFFAPLALMAALGVGGSPIRLTPRRGVTVWRQKPEPVPC